MVRRISQPAMQSNGMFGHLMTPQSRPKKKEVYYEDLYGKRNKDEDDEGTPEACESESDSDNEKSKKFSKSGDYERFFDGSYTGTSARGGKKTQPTSTTIDDQDTPIFKKRFKIAPNTNPKRSTNLSVLESRSSFEKVSFDETAEERKGRDNSPSAAADYRRSSLKRLPRPTSRRLFKQQLAAQDREKKDKNAVQAKEEKREQAAARREKKKDVRRRAEVPEGTARNKKAKLGEDLGSDDNPKTAYVLVDLTDVNVKEYERFSG